MAFTLVATSARPQHPKYLQEPPQHLSTRERNRMCQGEDEYIGNTEATGKVCVYPVSTQDFPQVGYPWKEGTEKVKELNTVVPLGRLHHTALANMPRALSSLIRSIALPAMPDWNGSNPSTDLLTLPYL